MDADEEPIATFPVRAAHRRDDGSIEVEFDVPAEHPVAEAARRGTLEHVSIGPDGAQPVLRPLHGQRREIDGRELRDRTEVPLPGRVDLSKVLDLNLPEEPDDGAPPGMRLVPLNRAERRRRGQRGRR